MTAPLSPERQPDAPATLPISLRDWFAGQALIGLMQGIGASQSSLTEQQLDRLYVVTAAEAYEVADAMLEEREKDR